jgi:hypothetical protein
VRRWATHILIVLFCVLVWVIVLAIQGKLGGFSRVRAILRGFGLPTTWECGLEGWVLLKLCTRKSLRCSLATGDLNKQKWGFCRKDQTNLDTHLAVDTIQVALEAQC